MAYRIFTSERLEFERSHLYRRAMEIPSRTISNGINRSPAGHATQDAPPRYAAIKQSISNAVRDGSLKPGDRVPSEAERSEEHTSELPSLMSILTAVFSWKKKII